MTQVESNTHEAVRTNAAIRGGHVVQTPIDRILQKLSLLNLPAKEHFERYMRL